MPSITSASAPERISFLASASAGAKQTSFAPLALIRSIAPPGGRPPASTTWLTSCLAQASISSLSCGCMVIRLTPNGRSVRVLVSAISVSSSSGLIAPQAMTPNPPALEMAETRWRSRNPAHRAAEDREVAAEEFGAAVHQLLEALVAGRRMDRAGFRDQPFAAHAVLPGRRRGRRRCAARAPRDRAASSAISALTLISLRRDREQVDLPLGEDLEHRRGELRVGADSDADDADLGHRVVLDQLGRSRSRLCAARSPPWPGRGSRAAP